MTSPWAVRLVPGLRGGRRAGSGQALFETICMVLTSHLPRPLELPPPASPGRLPERSWLRRRGVEEGAGAVRCEPKEVVKKETRIGRPAAHTCGRLELRIEC